MAKKKATKKIKKKASVKRPSKYEEKLFVNGSFDELLKASVPKK